MRRTEDFNELLSEELKDPDFARDYFLSKMNEIDGEPGLPLFEALKHVIKTMGVKEFAELVGMERQNISRIIAHDGPPKVETLNRLLTPLKLRVRLDIEEVA